MNDLKFALRQLLKNPGFTAVAVLTLGLGIGANTAIFSMIDAVLIKSLPVKDPERLVALTAVAGVEERERSSFSYPLFRDLRDRNQVFSGVFAFKGDSLNLSADGQTERVSGQMVSGNFFSVLGVNPHFGRMFSEADDQTPDGHPVAILGYGFWTRRFGSDPTLVGKTLHLNGYPFTVIGIAPPGFFGVEMGSSPDLWVPMMMRPQLSRRSNELQLWNRFWLPIMARMKAGVTEQQAQTATEILCQQIHQEAPGIRPALRSFLAKQRIHVRPAGQVMSSLRQQFRQP